MESPSRSPWTAGRVAIAVAILAVLVVVSVLQTANQQTGTDFHARWLAGRWFSAGQPLYQYLPGVREPSYPPFAAMAFQLFALFPLRVAAAGFYFVNLLLIPAAILLTQRIFMRLWPEQGHSRWPLVWATVFSAQFFLNNLNLVQVNTALFVLCLWGIDRHTRGHDSAAAAAFAVATFIKVVPGFFIAWLVLRGRGRAALAAVSLCLACVALPMLQRGVTTGIRDLAEYYQTFLRDFQESGVPARYNRYTNQSLGAAVFRLMRPPVPEERDYRVMEASESTARLVYRIAAAAVGVAFVGSLLLLRLRGTHATVFELSSVFLVGNLLSGITWKAHLVTLLFVNCAFLAVRPGELPRWLRMLVFVAIGLMVGTGLAGRDLVGNTVHHWIGGYSLLTWMMVLLFVGALALSGRVAAPAAASAT
jgi:alpha-1,2-mannosyltransferase